MYSIILCLFLIGAMQLMTRIQSSKCGFCFLENLNAVHLDF
jgi:hypothetical protein